MLIDHAVEDTHLSFIGDFTTAMFKQCLAGRGAAGQASCRAVL
jgi:hypothetical protein